MGKMLAGFVRYAESPMSKVAGHLIMAAILALLGWFGLGVSNWFAIKIATSGPMVSMRSSAEDALKKAAEAAEAAHTAGSLSRENTLAIVDLKGLLQRNFDATQQMGFSVERLKEQSIQTTRQLDRVANRMDALSDRIGDSRK